MEPSKSSSIFQHRSAIVSLALALSGLILIVAAQSFHSVAFKIELDRLMAEVGSLLLVVTLLHWLFEIGLREEMLKEVAETATGGVILHNSGLETCNLDSRQVEDRNHWMHSPHLTIGRQYSNRFLKDFHQILRERCQRGLPTTILMLNPDGAAATYLEATGIGDGSVRAAAVETQTLLGEYADGLATRIRLFFHTCVLRYAFIRTDEYIWVTLYRNSPGRATVPAFKVRAGTPLYEFFDRDIESLLEHSNEYA